MAEMSVTCQDCGKDLTWEGRDYSKCSGCGRELVIVVAPRGVGTGNCARSIVHSDETARLAARVEALEKADALVKAAVRLLRGDTPYPDWNWDEWITAAQLAGYDVNGVWEADRETTEAARKLLEGK